MTDTIVWTINEAPDGSPLVNASPSDIDMERADAVARLNPSACRCAVEAVRADVTTAQRLAAAALANVYGDAATWQHVRPDDLVPAAEPAEPERPDRGTIRPGHPAWTAEAETLLAIGGFGRDAEPDRHAARERLIARALAEGWSLRRLGHAILRERAEAADATHISALHVPDQRDPVAARLGHDDSASVWSRVARPPGPGEVTNATRAGF